MSGKEKQELLRRARESSAGRFIRRISAERDRVSVRITNLVFLPGVIARIGLRELAGLLLRIRLLHFGLSKALGGHVAVLNNAPRWKMAVVIVGTPLLLVPLGAMISSQVILDQITLNTFVPIPSTFDSEGYARALLEASTRFTGFDLMRIWCTVSCWFMLLVPHEDVMIVLSDPADGAGKSGWRGIRPLCRPIAVVSWVVTRASVFAGIAFVFISYGVTGVVIRMVSSWRLGL